MPKRFIQPLRLIIQWCYFLFILYIGFRFYQFVEHYRSGAPAVPRPDAIDGFLPVAALVGIRDWFITGHLNDIHPAAVVILLTIVVVALLLKRSFCSWICPVGAVSELFWKIGFSAFSRNFRAPNWLDITLRSLKYILLFFFLYSILFSMHPYQVAVFINSGYYKIADVRMLDFFLHLSTTALIVIAILFILSLPLRNPFCRFLCPYGALLGLVSFFSPVKVTREDAACVSCGACTKACPSHLPVMSKTRILSPECLGCWRCISNCHTEGALEMKLTGRKVIVPALVFAALVVVVFWGGSLVGKLTGTWHSEITDTQYRQLLSK